MVRNENRYQSRKLLFQYSLRCSLVEATLIANHRAAICAQAKNCIAQLRTHQHCLLLIPLELFSIKLLTQKLSHIYHYLRPAPVKVTLLEMTSRIRFNPLYRYINEMLKTEFQFVFKLGETNVWRKRLSYMK